MVLALGTIIEGKYRLDRVIASGGMGVVFAATHMALGRAVAVKVLKRELADDSRAAARLLAEARSAAAIKSPHIAEVIDVGMHDSVPFIVMELLEGRTSYDIVQGDGPLGLERSCDLLIQACHALGEAHRRGVIHRDVKPSNLFVARGEEREILKVIDFGISKTFAAGHETTTGTFLGSPPFMSPEQIQSARDIDGRSDVWSLGVVLYFFLTGKRPFEAESLLELMTLIVHESAPHLDGEIDGIVQTCLKKDRDERFTTTADLARALARFASPRARDLAAKVAVGMPPSRSASAARPPASPRPPPPPEEPTAPAIARPRELAVTLDSPSIAAAPRRRRALTLVWLGVGIGLAAGMTLIGLSSRSATSASPAPSADLPPPPAAQPSSAPPPPASVAADPSAPPAAAADSLAPPPARTHARPKSHVAVPAAPAPSPAVAPVPAPVEPHAPPGPPGPPTVKSGLPRVPD